MIPKELARKVRLIQIHTRKAVNDVLAGEYHSVFKGRGMEFNEVREYSPGDEIRSIDWNVTARMGRPFVKRFVEERELTVFFVVDLSGSGSFGTRAQLKQEVAAEVCALLAFSAINNNDKVGLLIFTDEVERFIPPKKGASHVLRLIRDLLQFEPRRKGTDIAVALDYLARILHKRAVVFLVSDFLAEGYDKPLRILSRRHDLVSITVADPRERSLPEVGLLELEDAETGKLVVIDTSDPAVRRRYEAEEKKRSAELSEKFRSMGVDRIDLTTGQDYVRDLVVFFRNRERRSGMGI